MHSNVKAADVQSTADRIGMILSTACAVECMLGPLVLATLAGAGWEFKIGDTFHSLFLLFICAFAAVNFFTSYKRHGDVRIWPLFAAAVLCFAAGRWTGEGPHEAWLTAAGGVFLVVCHGLNHRWCREGCHGRLEAAHTCDAVDEGNQSEA